MPHCSGCGEWTLEGSQLCAGCASTAHAPTQVIHDGDRGASASIGPGTELEGKWRLERLVGVGGMGQVYAAQDLTLGRRVAVKVMGPEVASNPEGLARFGREARMMARVDHPNLVAVQAVGEHQGRPFIVMKFLEGMSLASYLKALPGPPELPEVLRITDQVCAGLQFLHDKGLVHRDVKPSNLFISPEGHVTLLDFGILKEMNESLTVTGVAVGTPSYMSPEQAAGARVDARTDVYACALVVVQMLRGARGKGIPALELLATAETAPASPLAGTPGPVLQVLRRALSWDPEQRYATAAQFRSALEKAAADGRMPDASASTAATFPARRLPKLWVGGAAAVGACLLWPAARLWSHATSTTAPSKVAAAAVAEPPEAAPTIPPSRPLPTASAASLGPSSRVPALAPPTPPTGSRPPAAAALRATSAPKAVGTAARPEPHLAASRSPARRTLTRAPVTKAEPTRRGVLRVVTLDRGQPTWASVQVDGVDQGATPLDVHLPEGVHHVSVERAGFRSVERTLRVSAQEPSVLRVELTP